MSPESESISLHEILLMLMYVVGIICRAAGMLRKLRMHLAAT